MEYLVRTKKGHPALWEEGGGMSNTGHARIIADSQGQRKKPVFIRTGGHLACREHALFIVQEGDVVIDIQRHHDDYDITVKQIRKINQDAEGRLVAEMDVLVRFSEGEWDHEDIAEKYKDAIQACIEKSRCYHCRHTHYCILHPEFQRKVTIKFDDNLVATMTELCQQLGYRIDFRQVSEEEHHIPAIDKTHKVITCEYMKDELARLVNYILHRLEKIGLLEIDNINMTGTWISEHIADITVKIQ